MENAFLISFQELTMWDFRERTILNKNQTLINTMCGYIYMLFFSVSVSLSL